jgi:hypothetical protein
MVSQVAASAPGWVGMSAPLTPSGSLPGPSRAGLKGGKTGSGADDTGVFALADRDPGGGVDAGEA